LMGLHSTLLLRFARIDVLLVLTLQLDRSFDRIGVRMMFSTPPRA